jgi:hypothetical protein
LTIMIFEQWLWHSLIGCDLNLKQPEQMVN